jgi:subtilisin family serine protease
MYESDELPPALISGYISVKGTASPFEGKEALRAPLKAYQCKKTDRDEVEKHLVKAGFTILSSSPLGFGVSGPPSAYEELSGGSIKMGEVLTRVIGSAYRYVSRPDLVGAHQPKTFGLGLPKSKALKVDGIVLEKPRYPHAGLLLSGDPSPFPPTVPKYHLTLPSGVASALNAASVNRNGNSGGGVRVAMVDTGFYRHPFFLAQHYTIKPVQTVIPGTSPAKDPVGHGTGESANIFASAPDIEFYGIRAANDAGQLVGTMSGFLRAKDMSPKPQIISCSWGSNFDYPPVSDDESQVIGPSDAALVLEIQHALELGIVVIFSAGNGHFGVEPQVPGVISAGGAFMLADATLRASDYASGFHSPWFGGMDVPLVCGLVGLLPRAQYLMLPVQASCQLDDEESRDTQAEVGDGTTADDGWAMFSGTSAAAPQLAGVAALILAAVPGLSPAQVAEAMVKTATDVTTGSCNPRFANLAGPGHDLATGAGLVNAAAAVDYAVNNLSPGRS